MLTDPVCGMGVSDETMFNSVHEGSTYFFCSQDCMDEFEQNPEEYETESGHK